MFSSSGQKSPNSSRGSDVGIVPCASFNSSIDGCPAEAYFCSIVCAIKTSLHPAEAHGTRFELWRRNAGFTRTWTGSLDPTVRFRETAGHAARAPPTKHETRTRSLDSAESAGGSSHHPAAYQNLQSIRPGPRSSVPGVVIHAIRDSKVRATVGTPLGMSTVGQHVYTQCQSRVQQVPP